MYNFNIDNHGFIIEFSALFVEYSATGKFWSFGDRRRFNAVYHDTITYSTHQPFLL